MTDHERQGEGWIEWAGGECPVDPDTLVEVKYLAPAPENYFPGVRIEWPWPAGGLNWSHDGENDDIVAYRVGWS